MAQEQNNDSNIEPKEKVQDVPQTPVNDPVQPQKETIVDHSLEQTSQYAIETKIFGFIESGQTFQAYDIAKQAIIDFPKSILIKQGMALALLRTGAVEETKKIIEPIISDLDNYIANENMQNQSKIIHYLAMIFKELWFHGRITNDLEISRNLFLRSFEKDPNSTTGVNAAMLSWMIGEDEKCQTLAYKVISLHEKDIGSTNYKTHADAAQALLLLGEIDASLSWYTKALKLNTTGYKPLMEMRDSLFFLQAGGFIVPNQFFNTLPAPVVVVFAGPKIDKPSQETPIFPYHIEAKVKEAIKHKIEELNAQIGYSSAGCGSEMLFVECMLERGAEVNIVLPFSEEDFIENNVRYAGPRWERRFDKVIKKAHSISYATHDSFLGHNSLYDFANQVMHGTAAIRAHFLSGTPHLIALWNGEKAMGSVTEFINQWADISTLHIIDIDSLLDNDAPKVSTVTTPVIQEEIIQPQKSLDDSRVIKFMMFSDFAGYSKMNDRNVPEFLKFLENLAHIMETFKNKPESLNTWGDAVFAVMDNASDLAHYALEFLEHVEDLGCKLIGFKDPIKPRISLHAGPVYSSLDPFINRKNYYGSHINRAARLEPVTVIGQVYATQQFVALLSAEQNVLQFEAKQTGTYFHNKFITEYVGSIAFAKNFGQESVYHLRRNNNF